MDTTTIKAKVALICALTVRNLPTPLREIPGLRKWCGGKWGKITGCPWLDWLRNRTWRGQSVTHWIALNDQSLEWDENHGVVRGRHNDALCESAGRKKTHESKGDVAAPSDSQQQMAMPPSVGNAHNNTKDK